MLKRAWLLRALAVMAAIAGAHVTHRQAGAVRNCSGGPQSCILLTECPELLQLLRPPTRESIRRLQGLMCGFQNLRDPKVCCPAPRTVEEPSSSPRPTLPRSREDLLPETCGFPGYVNKLHGFGGIKAYLGAHPWMAVLGYTSEVRGTETETVWQCGGSLINHRYVLTAAHCTDRSIPLSKVRLGEHHLTTDPDCTGRHIRRCAPPVEEFTPSEIIRHPDYRKRGFYSDDLALVRLDRPVTFSDYIHPVCLPTAGQQFSELAKGRSRVTVTGWGDTETGLRSQELLELLLPIVPDAECRTILDYDTRLIGGGGQLCFGGGVGVDTCNKDSGGPAIITIDPRGPPFVQVGVVSYGLIRCGTQGVPGVYTDVSHYRSWILDAIKP